MGVAELLAAPPTPIGVPLGVPPKLGDCSPFLRQFAPFLAPGPVVATGRFPDRLKPFADTRRRFAVRTVTYVLVRKPSMRLRRSSCDEASARGSAAFPDVVKRKSLPAFVVVVSRWMFGNCLCLTLP